MQVKYLDITRQNKLVKQDFLNKVGEILDSGQISMGHLCREFEEKWAQKNGAKYCSLLSSGTDALVLAVDVINKDELVMTSALSFISTANAVILNRRIPVFCDTDSNGNIDVGEVSVGMAYHDVDVLMPVAMYGNSPDMEELQTICQKYKIVNLLDACQSHLATWNGRNLIDYCDALTHSFYISKSLGGYTEGGCVLSNNEYLIQEINGLRNHGREGDNYHFGSIGYNSRPSEILAASLLVKLPFIDEWTERRIAVAKRYDNNLRSLKDSGKLRFLEPGVKSKCIYHLYPIFLQNRDSVRQKLLELGVETQCQYPVPIHKQKSFKDFNQESLPVVEKLCNEVVTLPCYSEILDEEIDYVVEKLTEILK